MATLGTNEFFVKRAGFKPKYYQTITEQEFLAQPSFTRISSSWTRLKKNLTAEKVRQTKWLPIDKKIVYRERNEFINDLKKNSKKKGDYRMVSKRKNICGICRSSNRKV